MANETLKAIRISCNHPGCNLEEVFPFKPGLNYPEAVHAAILAQDRHVQTNIERDPTSGSVTRHRVDREEIILSSERH